MPPYFPGHTFLILEPDSPHPHLYIVLAVIADNPSSLIAVPLNSVTFNTDTTVILYPGDHPFIKHQTAVSYDRMREIDVSLLNKLESMSNDSNDPHFVRREPCDVKLLTTVQQGAFKSDLAKPKLVKKLSTALKDSRCL